MGGVQSRFVFIVHILGVNRDVIQTVFGLTMNYVNLTFSISSAL
jgi:hypothetical protein